MKQAIALLLCTALFLTGCSNQEKLKDGKYRAEVDADTAGAAYGWKDFVEVTISNGEVTAVTFNSVNDEGTLKTEDPSYVMDPMPSVWQPELVSRYMKEKDIDKVESVSGATTGSRNFKALMRAVLERAKTGGTDTITVDMTNVTE